MSTQSLPLTESSFPVTLDSSRSGTSLDSSAPRWTSNATVSWVLRAATHLPGWAWCVPGLAVLLLFLVPGPMLPWFVGKYAWTGKDFQEILGPSLLAGAVTVAGYQFLLRANACRVWMLAIPITLLCRELHFPGTGTGVYLALIAITVFGVRQAARLQPIWNCRHVCGCLFSAACVYVLAVSVDSGVWKFLPLSQWWGVNLEETLESAGHLCVLAGCICGVTIADRRFKKELE